MVCQMFLHFVSNTKTPQALKMKITILLLGLVANLVASAPANETTSSAVNFKIQLGDDEQDIVIDEEKNTEVFHSTYADDALIIDNFNLRIKVIAPAIGNKCYATTLNIETEQEPSKLKKIILQEEEEVCDIHLCLDIYANVNCNHA
ncbi:uncharacterized protein LOC144345470 [Saccoglossus kowalevskii]